MKEGGARPRKETTTNENKLREGGGTNSPVTFRGDGNLPREQSPVGLRERRTAVASLVSSVVEAQDFSEGVKAPGNADGLEALKFPCPSFKRSATGWFVHALVTMTSRKLSPFTSRDVIWSPPASAVMHNGLPRAATQLETNPITRIRGADLSRLDSGEVGPTVPIIVSYGKL